MPITYSIDRARRRLFTAAEGSVTYPEVMAHLEKERVDNGLPLNELVVATRAKVAFSPVDVRQVIKRLRDLGRHHALGPTAIVVDDDLSYGMMRMLEMLVEDVCDVRPFRNAGEAEAWLNTIPMPRPPTQVG